MGQVIMIIKDANPIKLEYTQTEIEKIMYILEKFTHISGINKEDNYELLKIYNDLQHKVDCHIDRKEWS
jgi:hypothetical protein